MRIHRFKKLIGPAITFVVVWAFLAWIDAKSWMLNAWLSAIFTVLSWENIRRNQCDYASFLSGCRRTGGG